MFCPWLFWHCCCLSVFVCTAHGLQQEESVTRVYVNGVALMSTDWLFNPWFTTGVVAFTKVCLRKGWAGWSAKQTSACYRSILLNLKCELLLHQNVNLNLNQNIPLVDTYIKNCSEVDQICSPAMWTLFCSYALPSMLYKRSTGFNHGPFDCA